MKRQIGYLLLCLLVCGSLQAAVLLDPITNNGSFENVIINDPLLSGETATRVFATEDWTVEGTSGWAMFTNTAYISKSVTEGSWGLSLNNGTNRSIVSDAIAYNGSAGDVLTLSFDGGDNGGGTNPTVTYTAWIYFNYYNTADTSNRVTVGSMTIAPPNGTLAYDTFSETIVLTEAVTSVYVKININNSTVTGNNDQVYLDNVNLLAYQEYDVNENGSNTFVVSLDADPNHYPVTVNIACTEPNAINPSAPEYDLGVSPMTFQLASREATQVVTLTGVNNTDLDGDRSYVLTITDSDPNNVVTPSDVIVNVLDDEVGQMLLLNAVDVTVAEGGIGTVPASWTLQVQLMGQSTADVDVLIDDLGDPNQVTIDVPASGVLTFTPAEILAQTAKDVTITAIDNDATEAVSHATTLRLTPSTTDASFALLGAQDVAVTILENDCGAAGFDPADLTEDCKVDLADLVELTSKWLNCYLPNTTAGSCQ